MLTSINGSAPSSKLVKIRLLLQLFHLLFSNIRALKEKVAFALHPGLFKKTFSRNKFSSENMFHTRDVSPQVTPKWRVL